MLSIHDDPGDVGMSGHEALSGDCHLHKVVHSGLGGGAGADGAPIEAVLLGALLALGGPVAGVGLEADDEGEGLGVLVVELEGAGLNEVSLTLPHTMLAGEGPAGPIGSALGVAVGVEVELADLPEVSSVGCCLEGADDVLLAVGTEGLEVKIDLDLVVVGGDDLLVEGEGESGQAGEEEKNQRLVHDMIGIIISKMGVLCLNISE